MKSARTDKNTSSENNDSSSAKKQKKQTNNKKSSRRGLKSSIISSTRLMILEYLRGNETPHSIYDISTATDISVSEIYRQLKVLRQLSIVKEHKIGKRKTLFTLNSNNPASEWLLNLNYFLEKTRNPTLFDAILTLDKYYFSGFFVFSLNTEDLVIVLPEEDELSLATVEAYSNKEKKITIMSVPEKEFRIREFNPTFLPPLVTPVEYDHNVASVEQALIDGLIQENEQILKLILNKQSEVIQATFTFDPTHLLELNQKLYDTRYEIASKCSYIGIIRECYRLPWIDYFLQDYRKRVPSQFRNKIHEIVTGKPSKPFNLKEIWSHELYDPDNILRHSAKLGIPESLLEHNLYFYETITLLTDILSHITNDFVIMGNTIYNLKYLESLPKRISFSPEIYFILSSRARDKLVLAFADLQNELFTREEIFLFPGEGDQELIPINGVNIELGATENLTLTRIVGTRWTGRPTRSYQFEIAQHVPFTHILEIPIRFIITDRFERAYPIELRQTTQIEPFFATDYKPLHYLTAQTTIPSISTEDINYEMSTEPLTINTLEKWVDVALLRKQGLDITVPDFVQDEIGYGSERNVYRLKYQLSDSFLEIRKHYSYKEIMDLLLENGR